jgi:hypothetical protein
MAASTDIHRESGSNQLNREDCGWEAWSCIGAFQERLESGGKAHLPGEAVRVAGDRGLKQNAPKR